MYILATESQRYLVQLQQVIGQMAGTGLLPFAAQPEKKIAKFKTSLKVSPLCTVHASTLMGARLADELACV